MSDLLPQDIQVEILTRLPVNSILTCKCVCKLWCNLLCSPEFVNNHLNRSIETNNFRIMSECHRSSGIFVLYSTDYASLSSESIPCTGAVLMEYPVQEHRDLNSVEIWGSCNGLICLSVSGRSEHEEDSICIWNPSTREYKKVPVEQCDYSISFDFLYTKYGFGYDCVNNDYKLVQVANLKESLGCQLRVYTLSSNSWNNIQMIPYFVCYCEGNFYGYLFRGALHWIGLSEKPYTDVIVCFDISNEMIVYVPLPEGLAIPQLGDANIRKNVGVWEGCLSLFYVVRNKSIDVWVMKDYGVGETWIKQFTITLSTTEPNFFRWVPVWAFQNGNILVNGVKDYVRQSYICNLKKGIFREVCIRLVVVGDLNKVILKGEDVFISRYQKVSKELNVEKSVIYIESLVSLKSGTYVGQQRRISQPGICTK